MKALVHSVRVFGVTAAQVHQAEQQCAERGEVVTVLEEVLTFPQKQDERVRPALEVWRREQHAMLGPLRQHHEHAAMQIWRRERPALPSLPHRHLSHEATNTTGARPAGALGAPHRHLSHEASNMSGARPDGASGATVGTARLAVLLALKALGTNAERVARADQRRSNLDELIAVLLTMLLDCQKSYSLVLAAEQGKGAAVSWLLGAGADPNSIGYEAIVFSPNSLARGCRLTPLVATIRGGNKEILHQLLETGADHEKEAEGMRPLMWAAAFGRVACVERLLLAGASVNAQDAHGNSALQHAAHGQHSSRNTEERDRRTALIVAMLLEAGVDKALVNHAGKTARRYAEKRRHTRVIVLLRDRPA